MLNPDRFREVVEKVSRDIVSIQHREGGSFISTPLMYPSGGFVVVKVDPSEGNYFVSDYGMGYEEAELLGGQSVYNRHARPIAEAAGVGFDNHSFFAIYVEEGRLPGAIATIANCSQEAVAVTARKMAERRQMAASDLLYQRLVEVYTQKLVSRDAEIIGASNTTWHISSVVREGKRVAAFEAVTKHHTSVAAAHTKFSDLARLDKPPNRVSVVSSKQSMDTYLSLLSQTSSVIELKAPDPTIKRFIDHAA